MFVRLTYFGFKTEKIKELKKFYNEVAIPTLRTPFAGVAMHIAEGRPVGSRCLELAEIRGLGKAQTFILKVNFVSASVEDTSISPPCDLAISAAI